jgi:hypothetical protein
MRETVDNPTMREIRLARRLERLFRVERTGGFARRPAATVRRLVERRGAVVAELLALDAARRGSAPPPLPAELGDALAELGREVKRSMTQAGQQQADLLAELRRRRPGGGSSGLRGGADGRLIGRG